MKKIHHCFKGPCAQFLKNIPKGGNPPPKFCFSIISMMQKQFFKKKLNGIVGAWQKLKNKNKKNRPLFSIFFFEFELEINLLNCHSIFFGKFFLHHA